MQQNKSGNPEFSEKALERIKDLESAKTATVNVSALKIFVLLAITVLAASIGWRAASSVNTLLNLGIIATGVLLMVTLIWLYFEVLRLLGNVRG